MQTLQRQAVLHLNAVVGAGSLAGPEATPPVPLARLAAAPAASIVRRTRALYCGMHTKVLMGRAALAILLGQTAAVVVAADRAAGWLVAPRRHRGRRDTRPRASAPAGPSRFTSHRPYSRRGRAHVRAVAPRRWAVRSRNVTMQLYHPHVVPFALQPAH